MGVCAAAKACAAPGKVACVRACRRRATACAAGLIPSPPRRAASPLRSHSISSATRRGRSTGASPASNTKSPHLRQRGTGAPQAGTERRLPRQADARRSPGCSQPAARGHGHACRHARTPTPARARARARAHHLSSVRLLHFQAAPASASGSSSLFSARAHQAWAAGFGLGSAWALAEAQRASKGRCRHSAPLHGRSPPAHSRPRAPCNPPSHRKQTSAPKQPACVHDHPGLKVQVHQVGQLRQAAAGLVAAQQRQLRHLRGARQSEQAPGRRRGWG